MSALFADIRIAVMNLVEHGRRTAFLGTAVAVVTCLFVLLTSLSAGIRDTLIDTATTLSTGHLNVGGFFKITGGQAAPIVANYETVQKVVLRAVPEVDFMVQRGRGWGKLISDQGSIQAGLAGIDIEMEPAVKSVLEIVQGNIDDLAQPNTILLFEQQAQKLSLKAGDSLTISAQTTRGVANTVDCRVAAVARDVGLLSSWNVFVSNDALRTLYQLKPNVTGALQIHVKPRDVPKLAGIATRLRHALEQAGYRMMEPDPRAFWLKFQTVTREDWTGQKLDVTTWEDELSYMMWTFTALQGLSFLLMLILLAIMIAGIMNTLWIAIRERTREIGTLRAIGMQQTGVARLFLFEAGMLGVLGAAAGVILGGIVIFLINAARIHVPISVQLFLMRDTVHLKLEASTLVMAIALITCVTGAAALYPSVRAARRKPVDAMAHFG